MDANTTAARTSRPHDGKGWKLIKTLTAEETAEARARMGLDTEGLRRSKDGLRRSKDG